MDETLEPYVKKMLDGGMKTAEDVAKFIETQTPELGREMITWGSLSEIVAPVLGLALLAAATLVHFKCRGGKGYYTDSFDLPPFMVIMSFGFFGMIIFIAQIMDVVYPLVAPRLYILEKIASFIK